MLGLPNVPLCCCNAASRRFSSVDGLESFIHRAAARCQVYLQPINSRLRGRSGIVSALQQHLGRSVFGIWACDFIGVLALRSARQRDREQAEGTGDGEVSVFNAVGDGCVALLSGCLVAAGEVVTQDSDRGVESIRTVDLMITGSSVLSPYPGCQSSCMQRFWTQYRGSSFHAPLPAAPCAIDSVAACRSW